MTKVLYVRVPDGVKDELDRLASESGYSLATVASHVLARGLNRTLQEPGRRLDALIAQRAEEGPS